MKILKRLIISFTLCIAVLVGIFVSPSSVLSANAAPVAPNIIETQANDLSRNESDSNPPIEERGPKSWIIKKGLGIIAKMIRSGGDEFVRLGAEFLDDGAKKAIRQNSDFIADNIDKVAGLPDLAGAIVREKLYNALAEPLGEGTAEVIAAAVEGVIWVIL